MTTQAEQDAQRREALRNQIAAMHTDLARAGVEIACAIAAGYTVANLPADVTAAILALRQALFDRESEMATLTGDAAPTLPFYLAAPPPSDPPANPPS